MSEPYVKAYLNPETGKIEYKSIGSPVKALDGKRVSGYLVRFTNANDTDLHGEWFNKQTNFWLKEHSPIGKPIMIDHAFDAKFKSVPVGIIDFAKEDEIGIWIEGKLKERKEYEDMLRGWKDRKYIDIDDSVITRAASGIEQAVKTFFSTGKAQWSSGALPQSVEIDETTKHIKSWAFIEGTGVYTPAEPDGTEIKLKSVFSTLDEILNSQQTDSPTVMKDGTDHKASDGASADSEPAQANVQSTNDKKTTPKTGAKMNIKTMKNRYRQTVRQELDAMVEQELAAIVETIAAEVGADVAPDDAEAIAEDVTSDIEAAVEATADDDAMMMADDELEEEKRKAARAIVGKHFYSVAYAKTYAHFGNKKAEVEKVKAEAQAKARLDYQKAQPAVSTLPAYTGNGNGHDPQANTRKWGQLTVSEMRAYADLSAEEMALVGKLAKSKAPEYDRKALTMGSFVERGILSEEFVKTLAHKAASQLDGWQVKNPQDVIAINDHATMKTVHWLKADELGATDITNQGAEWVELFYDTQAWRRVRDETRLYDLMVSKGMRVKDIPTGVKGMNVKLVDGNGTAYTLQEGGSVDATGRPEVVGNPSFITTNEVEENLATHIIAEGFTFQLAERSMINVAQELNEDIITTLAESLEDAILNGDKTTGASSNINLIDGTPGTGLSAPAYLAWDGVRHNVLVDNTAYGIDNVNTALAAVDYERVRALWPLRVRRRKDKILFVIDEGVETQTRRLAEHFTVGVAGESNATFFTGDLNVLVGYDVYASGFLGLSNGDGKISVTAGNNIQGQIYGIFCEYWQYGRQLAINIEEDRFALSQSSVFVATVNHLMKARSAFAAVGMYDIDV